MNNQNRRTRQIARASMIAAVYTVCTLLTMQFLGGLAFGPVQFRVSEALCALAVLTPAAIPGLTIGCFLSNLIGIAMFGTGALGLLDVVFGSLATFLGAFWCWKLRSKVGLALLGPVLANAVIVSAYLPIILAAAGFYTIPLTDISLEGIYPLMFLFGFVSTGIGEAIVVYALGLPLITALRNTSLFTDKTAQAATNT